MVEIILYISVNNRLDISYAVKFAARYIFFPKHSHELVLNRIGSYVKAKKDKVLILNLTSIMNIDFYLNCDLVRIFGHENPVDSSYVNIHTGCVITFSYCPIQFKFKLQTDTSLLTMEAGIIFLAHSCKYFFPLRTWLNLSMRRL